MNADFAGVVCIVGLVVFAAVVVFGIAFALEGGEVAHDNRNRERALTLCQRWYETHPCPSKPLPMYGWDYGGTRFLFSHDEVFSGVKR